uniref:Mitogen-activated protein kinase kinase kinase n=1 Tax=Ditylenchus dipsaci TaxID=166011 RepID=A0A915E2A7_9BILA
MDALHIDISHNCQPSSSSKSPSGEKSVYEEVSYNEVLFPDFQRLKRLGRGAYGTVVQCNFRNRLAAAKLVESTIDHVHIHNEAKLLHDFKHENIIKLYAVFHGEQTGLILELMEGGSLNERKGSFSRDFLIRLCCFSAPPEASHTIPGMHALGWALQVTSALTYLHSLGYVHRDLKPSNMLLTVDYVTLKLCDFGTAAELRTSMTNNRDPLHGWLLNFGILLWEIVTRKQPFDDWDTNPYTILWQVSEGRRPNTIEGECPEPVLELIKRCWSDNPKERPYIGEVNSVIEVLCEIYPNRFLPLIDRTSGQQALAERAERDNYYGQHSYFTPHQPPARPPPPSGHRRGNSHDYRSNNPNQLFYWTLAAIVLSGELRLLSGEARILRLVHRIGDLRLII